MLNDKKKQKKKQQQRNLDLIYLFILPSQYET